MNEPFIQTIIQLIESFYQRIPGLRYVSLWILFTLLMVLFPFIEGPFGSIVFTLIFSLIVVSSVLTASGTKTAKRIAVILMVLTIGARWSYFLFGGAILAGLSYSFAAMTLATVAFLLLIALFHTKEVSSQTIWQAISVYLLLGLTWACLYAFTEVLAPGSFMDTAYPDVTMTFPTLVYFSFVTLATLGYGDILPTTQVSRGLIIIEVLMGVLYMAILISRLVGTWKPSEEKGRK